jgi:hypothetical protein
MIIQIISSAEYLATILDEQLESKVGSGFKIFIVDKANWLIQFQLLWTLALVDSGKPFNRNPRYEMATLLLVALSSRTSSYPVEQSVMDDFDKYATLLRGTFKLAQ